MESTSTTDCAADDSFSFDGYERLHDEMMDQISVSIYSNSEDAFGRHSRSNLVIADVENQVEKKMKISLSQEQLKLNGNKNFLTVPVSGKKARSASFSIADGKTMPKRSVRIANDVEKLSSNLLTVECVKPSISIESVQHANDDDGDVNEVIYAVPQKQLLHPKTPHAEGISDVKTSSASLLSMKSFTSSHTENEVDFKYPLAFYCKVCNKILEDPRVLDCLHSFCCQCLVQLDASCDLQNNQFWRKISDSSSCM